VSGLGRRQKVPGTRGIYQRSPGVLWVGFRDSLGRWRWHPGGASVAEAEQVRAEMLALAKRGVGMPAKRRILVRDATAAWLNEFASQVEQGRKERTTLERYREAARLIDALIGDQRVYNLDRFVVARLATTLRARGLSLTTCQHALRTLSAILEYTRRNRLLDYNPVAEYQRHAKAAAASKQDRHETRRREPAALSETELERLLAETPESWRVAFACMASLGLRSSELLALRRSDIRGAQVRVNGRVEQGAIREYPAGDRRRRRLAIPPDLAHELDARRSASSVDSTEGLVVSHRDGRPYTRRSLDLALAKAVAAAGLDPALTAANLRHSHAARRIANGCDLATLSAELGQAIDSTYRTYANLFEKAGGCEQARQSRRQAATKRPPSTTRNERLIKTLDRERLRWSGKRKAIRMSQASQQSGLPLKVVQRY
jgi:integrase